MIRTRVAGIREMGRATQGVTLITLDKGTTLSGLQQVAETETEVDDNTESEVDANTEANPEAGSSLEND